MRAFELFESDYNDDLRSEVITLLTAVSAEGIDEVNMQNLLLDLESQGYAVDVQSLLDLLSTMEIVVTANKDKIQIATSDEAMMVGDGSEEIAQDRVDNLATAQATDDIKDDL